MKLDAKVSIDSDLMDDKVWTIEEYQQSAIQHPMAIADIFPILH